MTKDELRQEIERLKAEVKRLESQVAALGNGRTNMLEISQSRPLPQRDEDWHDV